MTTFLNVLFIYFTKNIRSNNNCHIIQYLKIICNNGFLDLPRYFNLKKFEYPSSTSLRRASRDRNLDQN